MSSVNLDLDPNTSVAYRRGRIMAHCIPATRKTATKFSRPYGLNPYDLDTDEYEHWQYGYAHETAAMHGIGNHSISIAFRLNTYV